MASRKLLRVLKEMDMVEAQRLFYQNGRVTIDNPKIILASMHRARCTLGTKYFDAHELIASRLWLTAYGFDVPIGHKAVPMIRKLY